MRAMPFVFASILAFALATSLTLGANTGRALPACGTERWTVKTLQDRPRLLPVRATTIA